jgi:hypothetical protein
MLIRAVLAVAFLAAPLASSAASFDVTKVAGAAAKIVKAVDTADGAFQTHFRFWRRHDHGNKHRKLGLSTNGRPDIEPKPGPSVPEPSAALLFGLGAIAVGVGIRRRR